MYTITVLYGEMTKTKVVDLNRFYNFVVDDFSVEIIYYLKMLFEVIII
jgi:hypothetical protein